MPKGQVLWLSRLDSDQAAVDFLPSRKVSLLELSLLLEIYVHQLMIHSLASMIHEVRYGDQTSLTEVVTETSVHDCSVAEMESFA